MDRVYDAKHRIACELRRITNQAVADGEIAGDDALAVYMHIVTAMLAQVRDEELRGKYVLMIVETLPLLVEIERVGTTSGGWC